MPQLPTTWTGPPSLRVYPCPACQEAISVDTTSCRFCHVTTDVKVAEQLWAENQQIKKVITRANTYNSLTAALLPVTAIIVWTMFRFGGLTESWVVCQLLALSYGVQWLIRNRSLVTTNADYVEAVAKVKHAMLGWVALLLVQVAAYLILNGLPDWNMILQPFVVE